VLLRPVANVMWLLQMVTFPAALREGISNWRDMRYKLVMATYQMDEKCKFCVKVDTKRGRIRKEQERIKRWNKEDRHGRKASIAAAEDIIDNLENVVSGLLSLGCIRHG
jgi:hypothetical protein